MSKNPSNTVAIVGLGYVGLPLALLADRKGYQVLGIDADEAKIDKISKGLSPFIDDVVSEQLISSNLEVTTNPEKVSGVEVIVVCVPTPVDEFSMPNLGPVIRACTSIANNMVKGQLVIIESTINPGVCDEVVIPTLEKNSGMKCGQDFYVAHCPERINPGDPKWNVSNIARVVGGYDSKSLDLAVKFYEDIIDAPIKRMNSLKEAEAVKVVENSFRDVNIAFVNELAMSFTNLGINVVNIIDGAATKPFAFMPHYPGMGVGGHCIPVDPYYLIEYAKNHGFEHEFLVAARRINSNMPFFTVTLLEEGLAQVGKNISTAKITVLGLSYKPNVGDLRESPSLVLISELRSRGASLAVYDPYIEHMDGVSDCHVQKQIAAFFETPESMESERMWAAVRGADAVIIATAHNVIKFIDLVALHREGVSVLVDGRNCVDPVIAASAGLIYKGIGT